MINIAEALNVIVICVPKNHNVRNIKQYKRNSLFCLQVFRALYEKMWNDSGSLIFLLAKYWYKIGC